MGYSVVGERPNTDFVMEPDVLDWGIFRADQGDAVHHCEDGERLCGYGEEWVHGGLERITEDTEKKRE